MNEGIITDFMNKIIDDSQKKMNESCELENEAKIYSFALAGLDFDNPELDLVQAMKEIHEALIFILRSIKFGD